MLRQNQNLTNELNPKIGSNRQRLIQMIIEKLEKNIELLRGCAHNTTTEQFKNIYLLIAKDLFMNILLTIKIIREEKLNYNQFSICESIENN